MPVKTTAKANNKIFKPQSAHTDRAKEENTMKNAVIYAVSVHTHRTSKALSDNSKNVTLSQSGAVCA